MKQYYLCLKKVDLQLIGKLKNHFWEQYEELSPGEILIVINNIFLDKKIVYGEIIDYYTNLTDDPGYIKPVFEIKSLPLWIGIKTLRRLTDEEILALNFGLI